jgi:1,4-dihydroxy-2-naphthoate octaprenyltransferase
MTLGSVKQMVMLARLPIAIGVLPTFFLGSLFALITGNEFLWVNFLWGFLILFLIEIAAAYANDYFDYEGDKHNQQFGFSGGSGVLQKHPQLLPVAKWSAVFLFFISFVLTLLMVWHFSFPLWIVGYILTAILFCWFYTAPPIKLAYRGLGELPHMLAGIMFPGWGYIILTGTLDWSLLIFALPFGFSGLTVILNFEIPDREADLNAKKSNLIVIMGRRFTFKVIFGLYLLVSLYFFGLGLTGFLGEKINFYIIAVISLIPTFFSLLGAVKATREKESATRYTIRTAVSHFISVFLIMGYFLYLRY